MYAYYWVHTSAQLDLIAYDTPIVVYDRDKGEDAKHSKKEMDDLRKRWEEKKRQEEERGEKINFKDFINTSASQLGSTQN